MHSQVSDIHWLAGFLDGEGCFQFHKNRCVIQTVQKDAWPLMKAHRIVGGRFYRVRNDRFGKKRLYFMLSMTGKRAAGVMMTIYTLMSPRRQRKIADCLAQWRVILNRGACNTKTHCKRGHALNPETTFIQSNGKSRECIVCSRMSKLKSYHKLKVSSIPNEARVLSPALKE